MQNISLEDLDLVCGATGTANTTNSAPVSTGTGTSSTAGSGSDALMTSLNSISSSIKDLSNKNNNGGLFGGSNGLLFLGMALAMRRNDSTVIVNGGGGCNHGSYSWHARW